MARGNRVSQTKHFHEVRGAVTGGEGGGDPVASKRSGSDGPLEGDGQNAPPTAPLASSRGLARGGRGTPSMDGDELGEE